ncbi:hypothetical protein KEJ47_04925 [Candidatus Bathyarchaeota archaeon]|nr:hypothetical protein [Candidatus Bathyarchaeota archaeon]
MAACIVALSAIIGGIALTTYAADNTGENGAQVEPISKEFCGFRPLRWVWRGERFEISAEYNETVISIAQSDEDVQNLLSDGYSISSIRPIIKRTIEGDGSVTQKASSSIVVLTKNNFGRAAVWVDLESNKVTKIVIFTMTVIDKSS